MFGHKPQRTTGRKPHTLLSVRPYGKIVKYPTRGALGQGGVQNPQKFWLAMVPVAQA